MAGPQQVVLDVSAMLAEVAKIVAAMRGFPDAAKVAVSEGGQTPRTMEFRAAVGTAAEAMGRSTKRAVDALTDMDATIRKVLAQLVENDESLKDESDRVLALLDAAAEPEPPKPTSGPRYSRNRPVAE